METIDKTSTTPTELVDDKPQVINADLRKFNRSEQMVTKAVGALSAITVITGKEDCDHALSTLKEAKTVENAIEKKRKELVQPFNDAVKKINAYAKELTERLPKSIDIVKNLVLQFQKEEQEKAAKLRRDQRIAQLTSLSFEQTESGYKYHDAFSVQNWMIDNLDDNGWLQLIADAQQAVTNYKSKQLEEKKADLENLEFFGEAADVDQLKSDIQQLESAPAAALSSYTSVSATKVKGTTKRWTFEVTDESQIPREYLTVDEKKIREAVMNGTRIIPGVRIYQSESLTIR